MQSDQEIIQLPSIKTMSEQELKIVMEWAEREGWNPGKFDYIAYYRFDPNGHFLLHLNGKPVGAISVVTYSDQFTFLGLFIVLPQFRQKGYGKILWQHAMNYIRDRNTTGLYSVPTQISRYKSSGFREGYSNHRWSLTPVHLSEQSHSPPLARISQKAPKLFEYDQRVFGHNRQPLLNNILGLPQTHAFVFTDENNEVRGYGVVRPCYRGYRFGPLYADNFESAKKICEHLLKEVKKIQGEQLIQIIFDIPTANPFEVSFAEYFHLEHVPAADTLAMFKGKAPTEIHQEKCYGTLSLEVG